LVSVTAGGEVSEGAMNAMAVFTLSLPAPASPSNARTDELTVSFTLGGTATGGDSNNATRDYTTPTGTPTGTLEVTFPNDNTAAATTQTVMIPINNDDLNEAPETITLTLSAVTDANNATKFPGGAGVMSGDFSVTITDDDDVTYSIANAVAVTEVDSGGTNPTMRFTVSLSGLSAGTVTIPYTLSGTATSGTDFTAPAGTVTIAANSRSETIDITVLADNLNEAAETITVTLGDERATGFEVGSGGGAVTLSDTTGDNTATGTINDDDQLTVTLSGGGTVDEGSNATVTATLSGATATGAVTVAYTLGATAATNDNDAEDDDTTGANSGTITVADGQTTGRVNIAVAAPKRVA